MRGFLFLFVLLGLGFAQGVPQVREVDENTLYWFLVSRVNEVVVFGLPPVRLGEALRDKKVTLVLGNEAVPSWAQRAKVVRLGGGRMGGVLILGDTRFLVAPKGGKWVILDHPATVAVLWGYLGAALGSLR